ncbi:MAG: lysophospholipid acyltransferase family protein [Betaproteobacteria bacterium]|nr:lysophospholipid acyltransferase family protein [Gammaproteobacteria bacterium]MDH3436611.1 lysophospholipid acyltransferase family protein [Betaproteobacteria bacterium]
MRSATNSEVLQQSHRALQGMGPGLRLLFRLIAVLPLRVVQAVGASLAVVALVFVRRERTRLVENLRAAGFGTPGQARAATAEAGKVLLEMVWFWQRPQDELVKLVRRVEGEHWVAEAQARGKGIIFLTPHLGCFEIAAHFAASHSPITVIYRPPRQRLFRSFAQLGRARGNIRLVEANTRGATASLAALRRGEWVGILPDQVPTRGEGEWAEFFGRPAYTMTLWSRLQQRTGAAVILCFCERLAHGGGYHIHLEPLPTLEPEESPVRQLNRALENLIRRRPEQYLWSYARHRIPFGVAPPTGSDSNE